MFEEVDLYTCDRCCKTLVVKKYNSLPKVWLHIQDYGHLCDECADKFRSFASTFFGVKVPEQWDDICNQV